MRWFWIDRFTSFAVGARASAIKNVTLAEDYLHDHFPGYPIFPAALMIEGMAQTAGILVGQARSFRENVILAKIRVAEFEDYAFPGDQLEYHAMLVNLDDQGAVTEGRVAKNGAEIGRIDLMFSHVNEQQQIPGLPERNFVFDDNFLSLRASIDALIRGEVCDG